jgi:hypothetical protein
MPDGDTSSSLARLAANRANALRSTGPRTPAGLEVSRSNALVHGLSARAVVIRGESAAQWEAFRDTTVNDLAAVGPVEAALAARAAELLWRLQRAGAAEAAVATFTLARAERESIVVALERTTGAGDGAPFSLRHCDRVADLRAAGERARAAAAAADLAIDGADAEPLPSGAAKDLLRVAAIIVSGVDPEMASRPSRGFAGQVITLGGWTVKAMRAATDDLADGSGDNILRQARRVCLETTVRAWLAAEDAAQRVALAEATAATGDDSAAVRRHEAHLQRQLAGVLALLDATQRRRQPRSG